MTETKPTVTRPAFEELIARALEIQDRSGERVELDRARAIALELGVSPEAWEEALEERRLAAEAPAAPITAPSSTMKPLSLAALSSMSVRKLALTGVALGAVSAFVAGRFGAIGIPLGASGIVLGALLAVESAKRGPAGWHLRIGAWWTSITIGMMIGIGGPHPDPVVYGAAGWLVSEAVAWVMRRRDKT